MCASIVAGVDAPPVLDTSEHDLDAVALTIERLVMRDGDLAVGLGRDAGGDAPVGEGLAEPAGVIATVAEHRLGPRQRMEHQRGTLVVTHLPLAQQHDAGPALSVADRMQLGVQAAFGAPDTSGNIPFLSRLAAVRCALR